MTRQDYIVHLDGLRRGVLKLIVFDSRHKDMNGPLVGATELEDDRAKKTQKMFEDLAVRLYEDAAVSERVKIEKLEAGDLEQAEMTFTEEMVEKVAETMEKQGKRKGGAK